MSDTTNRKRLTFLYRGNPFLDGIVQEVQAGVEGYDVQAIKIPQDCSVTPAMEQSIEEAMGEVEERRGQIITDETALTAIPDDLEGKLREMLSTRPRTLRNTVQRSVTTFQNIATELQGSSPEGYHELYRAIARDARSAGIEEMAVVLTRQVLVDGIKPEFRGGSLADHGILEGEKYIGKDNFDSERMRRVFESVREAFAAEGITARPAVCIVEEQNNKYTERSYYILPSVEAIRFQPGERASGTPLYVDLEGATILGMNFEDRGVFIDRHTLPYEDLGENYHLLAKRIYAKHEGIAVAILEGRANYTSSYSPGSFVTLPVEETRTMAEYIIDGLKENREVGGRK